MLRAVAVRCWLLLLALSFPVSAQIQDLSGAATNNSAKYSLTGTVVNSVTREPVRRALVQIFAGNQQTTLTDSSGRFEFDNLPPAQTSINVRKPGFFDQRELRRGFLNPPMATIGPDSQPMILELIPESVVYGRILGAAGEPIEALRVLLITSEIVDGRKRWQQSGEATTNDDGEFRIANLRPGTYYLEAGPASRSQLTNPLSAYPLLFYPGVSDLSAATPLEVAPGQQQNVDLSVRPVPMLKVSGSIAGIAPDQGINLEFRDQLGNSESLGQQFDVKTGQFQATAPAGSYTVIVNAWNTNGEHSSNEFPLNLTSDISGLRLALAPENSIPIHVRSEATHALVDTPPMRTDFPIPNIRLVDGSNTLFSSGSMSMVVQGSKNPLITLQNVRPGKYSIETYANPPWYVQSAQCGETDLLREELTIAAGTQTPPIEVVLRDDGATLTGRLNAGANARQATILLVPDHGSLIRSEITFNLASPPPEFTVGNIAPGSYSIYAFDRVDKLEYRNPEVLSRYSSKAAHVTLQPNGQQKVDVELITAGDGP